MKLSKKELINMNRVERNCYGNNLINQLAIENISLAVPQLKELVGKEILMANGSYRKNIRDISRLKKESFRSHFKTNYHKKGYNSIWLCQDVTVYCAEFTVNYYKQSICIGRCNDGILTEVFSIKDIISSYKLNKPYIYNDVLAKLEQLKELKNQVRVLESETSKIDKVY